MDTSVRKQSIQCSVIMIIMLLDFAEVVQVGKSIRRFGATYQNINLILDRLIIFWLNK